MDINTYDEEAIYQDADILQAQYEAESNRYWRLKQAGYCTHGGWFCHVDPPYYPEQVDLKPGEARCNDGCGLIFDTEDQLRDAGPVKISDIPQGCERYSQLV